MLTEKETVLLSLLTIALSVLIVVPVDLSFLGDQWLLTCPGKDGKPLYRYFR